MALALLIARLVLGLGIAVHGVQKLFGWFGGHGLQGTGAFFDAMGFRPGRRFAFLAGAGEAGGGLLIALGLLGPIGPALLVLVMTVAMLTVHGKHGFLASNNGVELPLLYAAAGLVLAFTGPGGYALDALVGLPWEWGPRSTWLAIGGALAVAGANLVLRRPSVAAPATSPTNAAP